MDGEFVVVFFCLLFLFEENVYEENLYYVDGVEDVVYVFYLWNCVFESVRQEMEQGLVFLQEMEKLYFIQLNLFIIFRCNLYMYDFFKVGDEK